MEAAGGGGSGYAGRGVGRVELQRQMAAGRAAFERKIAAGRERAASATNRAALLSARCHSHQTLSQQDELTKLKDSFRELEGHLAQTLSTKFSKDAKCELTNERISTTAAISGQLKGLLTDQRNKRDQHAAVISNQLEAVEALEAKSNEDETLRKDIAEAVTWYNTFLGFQVIGGEGVKFVFNRVDLRSPDNEYSFSIKLDKDIYNLLQCEPHMKDLEELMKDLNITKDLFDFVRTIRQRFQSATLNGMFPVSSIVSPDACSLTLSSPVVMSIDARGENVASQSCSRSKDKKQSIPSKRRAAGAGLLAVSDAVVSSVRRSPRFVGIR